MNTEYTEKSYSTVGPTSFQPSPWRNIYTVPDKGNQFIAKKVWEWVKLPGIYWLYQILYHPFFVSLVEHWYSLLNMELKYQLENMEGSYDLMEGSVTILRMQCIYWIKTFICCRVPNTKNTWIPTILSLPCSRPGSPHLHTFIRGFNKTHRAPWRTIIFQRSLKSYPATQLQVRDIDF